MSCACPTCGQTLPDDGALRVDDAGVIVRNGAVARVGGKEMEIVRLLYRAAGCFVSRSAIESALWPADADLPNGEVIQSLISKLRRKLAPLGLTIEGASRGVGAYRLVTKADGGSA